MSFSTEILKPNSNIRTLVRLRPRMRLTGWTVNGTYSNVYQIAWTERLIVGLLHNHPVNYVDEETSLANCASSDNSFFYDSSAQILYFNPPSTESPNLYFTVIEWDVLLSTEPLNWYRNPMDSTSGDAHWEGGIVRAPAPTQGNPDLIFGYNPVNVSNLAFQAADGALFKYMHKWSLNNSQVKVWICVGELSILNISELFVGIGANCSMRDGVFSLQVRDPLQLLEQEWDGTFFSTDDFSSLNPDEVGLPIREVFGFMPSFLPVNVDYNATPSTTVNRDWCVSKGAIADSAQLVRTIVSAPSNTETIVSDVSGFQSGDRIVVENGGVNKYTSIAFIDEGTNKITHGDIGSRTVSGGDEVKRGFNQAVFILVDNVLFELEYLRDWTEVDMANGSKGIVLANNFEANLTSPAFPSPFDPSQHTLYVATYGERTLPKKLNGITDFGQHTARGGTAGHPVVVLWDILRNRIRTFRESVLLDEDAWSDMALDFDRAIGLAVPETKTGQFPNYKEVCQLLLQTELLRLHFKIDGFSYLTITQTAPSSGDSMEMTEVEASGVEFEWDYSDVYNKIKLSLNQGEVLGEAYREANEDTIYTYPDLVNEFSPLRAAGYLHKVSKTFEFRSLFPLALNDESDLIAWRLAKIIGERRGTISANLPVSFITESIDDKTSVELLRLPGFAVSGEINTRAYKIGRHQKSAQGVSLTLDDQKGIEDHSRW